MKKNIFLVIGLLSAGIMSAEAPMEQTGKALSEGMDVLAGHVKKGAEVAGELATTGAKMAGEGIVSGIVSANAALDEVGKRSGEAIVEGIHRAEAFADKVSEKLHEVGSEVGAHLAEDRIIQLGIKQTKLEDALSVAQTSLSEKTSALNAAESALAETQAALQVALAEKVAPVAPVAKTVAPAAPEVKTVAPAANTASSTTATAGQSGQAGVTWKEFTMEKLGSAKDSVVGGLAFVYDFTVALPSNIAAGTSSAWNASVNGVSSASTRGMEKLTTTWNKGNAEKAAIITVGVALTAAVTYGMYRAATSEKAKSFYSWVGSKFSSNKS